MLMTAHTDFYGATPELVKLKLARARKYLSTLTAEIRAFDAAPPWSVDWSDRDDQCFEFRSPKIDPEWQVTVGEICFHARSALDQMVTQVVIASGGDGDAHKGGFPIYRNEEDYLRVTKRRQLSARDLALKGTPEPFRLLIDELQPFLHPSGADHHPLERLNSLCNADKHRYGHPAYPALRFIDLSISKDEVVVYSDYDYQARFNIDIGRGRVLTPGCDPLAFLSQDRTDKLDAALEKYDGGAPGAPVEMRMTVGVVFGPLRVFSFELGYLLDFVDDVVNVLEPFTHAS